MKFLNKPKYPTDKVFYLYHSLRKLTNVHFDPNHFELP